MKKTLKSIDTEVRAVLHELGFARVVKQVDRINLHILKGTAKIAINPLKPKTGDNVQVVEFSTFLAKDDGDPTVTIYYQSSQVYNKGKFPTTKITGCTHSPDFQFESKEKLLADIQGWLKEKHLHLRYDW